MHWHGYKNTSVLKIEYVCVVISRKPSPKSNPLNYSPVKWYPQAMLPLANQSQQIVMVNISGSADLDRDMVIVAIIIPLCFAVALNTYWSLFLNPAWTDFMFILLLHCQREKKANCGKTVLNGKLIGSMCLAEMNGEMNSADVSSESPLLAAGKLTNDRLTVGIILSNVS